MPTARMAGNDAAGFYGNSKFKHNNIVEFNSPGVYCFGMTFLNCRGVFKAGGRRAVFLYLLAVLALFQTACAGAPYGRTGETHWGYTGDTGPAYWHTLDAVYAVAKDGRAQSPVDIRTADLVPPDTVKKPRIYYHATEFEIEDNGHTIEIVPLEHDNYIIIDNGRLSLTANAFSFTRRTYR
jgi:hypothetical protein